MCRIKEETKGIEEGEEGLGKCAVWLEKKWFVAEGWWGNKYFQLW